MLRPAFSTVACPDWTLERVAQAAAEFRFDGVELRTFGQGKSEFACEPGLTDPAKVRRLFADVGVQIAGLATSVRFDAPIFPPVLGNLLPQREAAVNEGKRSVALASACGSRFVRVFGFEIGQRENRRAAITRISDRLARVCDYAHNRDVTVLLENAASFPGAADVAEILERVQSPHLGVCYDLASAFAVGETPAEGVKILGSAMKAARVRDVEDGRPVPLGHGELPNRDLVAAMRSAGLDAWLIFTWDRAWRPELAPAEKVLPEAAHRLWEWIGSKSVAAA
jgi:sugar phosphate isomerase/epimerase